MNIIHTGAQIRVTPRNELSLNMVPHHLRGGTEYKDKYVCLALTIKTIA